MLRSSQLVTFQRRSESGRGEERNDRPALSWCRTCYGTANPVGEFWPRLSAYWAAATVPRHVRQPRLSPFLPPFRNFLAISAFLASYSRLRRGARNRVLPASTR